jgi:hypothetical protein
MLAASPLLVRGEPVQREVLEFESGDSESRGKVILVVPDSAAMDVLRGAYRSGREDQAGEQ